VVTRQEPPGLEARGGLSFLPIELRSDAGAGCDPEWKFFRRGDGGPLGGQRRPITGPAFRPLGQPKQKGNPPACDAGEIRPSSELTTRQNAERSFFSRFQGAARGLIPIDCAAIWYQLVDLKTVMRRAVLRLLRLALALTCDPRRTE
jgi:hypothetical protein